MEPLQLLRNITILYSQNAVIQPFNSPQQLPVAPPPLGQLVFHGNINYPDVDVEVSHLIGLLFVMYKTDTRFSKQASVREHDDKISRTLTHLVATLTPNQTYYPLGLIISLQNIIALENLVQSHLPRPYIRPETCECWGCRMNCETAYVSAQKALPDRDRNYPCTRS